KAEDGIRDPLVTGVQTCALPISFRATIESLMSAAMEYDVPELIEEVLARSGYIESLEAERTIEAQGRMENLQELVSVAREWREQDRKSVVEGKSGDTGACR